MTDVKNDSHSVFRDTFFGILSHDVVICWERIEVADTQATRRDLIRTMFAAIEGYVWEYRTYVRSVVEHVGMISPMMELALTETSYSVNEQGGLERHIRFISLTSMIRLVTKLAQEHCPGLEIDFSNAGWSNLKQTIKIRNRITHPRNLSDLEITQNDIAISQAGFFWILKLIVEVMEASGAVLAQYISDFRLLVEQLSNGDPNALADYQVAQAALNLHDS
jgi:hypothetical protein